MLEDRLESRMLPKRIEQRLRRQRHYPEFSLDYSGFEQVQRSIGITKAAVDGCPVKRRCEMMSADPVEFRKSAQRGRGIARTRIRIAESRQQLAEKRATSEVRPGFAADVYCGVVVALCGERTGEEYVGPMKGRVQIKRLAAMFDGFIEAAFEVVQSAEIACDSGGEEIETLGLPERGRARFKIWTVHRAEDREGMPGVRLARVEAESSLPFFCGSEGISAVCH